LDDGQGASRLDGRLDGVRIGLLQEVERAGDAGDAFASDVGIDHGCFQTLVAEQELDCANIDAALDLSRDAAVAGPGCAWRPAAHFTETCFLRRQAGRADRAG
jgi:hypothetical protein